MSKEERYEQIENYLTGTMEATEADAFEARMATDQGLRSEVLLHAQLQKKLAGAQLRQLRGILREVDGSWTAPSEKTGVRLVSIRYISMAAAAVALLILGCWYFFIAPQSSPKSLFAAHFEPYDLIAGNRSSLPTEEDDFAEVSGQARRAYESGNFELAAASFRTLAEAEPANESWHFYQAVSLLAIGRGSEASVIFEILAGKQDSLFREQAAWYLALCYLSEDDVEKARAILDRIQPGNYKYREALALRKRLAK